MASHLESGHVAERIARTRLEHSGLSCIETNYRCRFGELDLIMADHGTLVIVEVRYRRHTTVMDPCQSLTRNKLRRIMAATRHFLQQRPHWRGHPVRFDVVGLHGPLQEVGVNWIRGAFTIDEL